MSWARLAPLVRTYYLAKTNCDEIAFTMDRMPEALRVGGDDFFETANGLRVESRFHHTHDLLGCFSEDVLFSVEIPWSADLGVVGRELDRLRAQKAGLWADLVARVEHAQVDKRVIVEQADQREIQYRLHVDGLHLDLGYQVPSNIEEWIRFLIRARTQWAVPYFRATRKAMNL